MADPRTTPIDPEVTEEIDGGRTTPRSAKKEETRPSSLFRGEP